jgi:hypothetical protein
MLDITKDNLDDLVKEVERQINRLQINEPLEIESSKEEEKLAELIDDSNKSETESLNAWAILNTTSI